MNTTNETAAAADDSNENNSIPEVVIPEAKPAKPAKPAKAPKLSDVLSDSDSEEVSIASGKVTVSTLLKCDTASARAAVYSDKRAIAACDTTPESIEASKLNRTRSLIATVRGTSGLIVKAGEAPAEAFRRMLYGNGRTHFGTFLKLPRTVIRQLPREYALTHCVDADGASKSHGKTATMLPCMFADK
jgi:hypothetical protein